MNHYNFCVNGTGDNLNSFLCFYLQFWSVYVPCEAQYLNTVQVLMEQLDVIKRMIALHTRETVLVTSSQGKLTIGFLQGKLA